MLDQGHFDVDSIPDDVCWHILSFVPRFRIEATAACQRFVTSRKRRPFIPRDKTEDELEAMVRFLKPIWSTVFA
jgi:hypothetical protein